MLAAPNSWKMYWQLVSECKRNGIPLDWNFKFSLHWVSSTIKAKTKQYKNCLDLSPEFKGHQCQYTLKFPSLSFLHDMVQIWCYLTHIIVSCRYKIISFTPRDQKISPGACKISFVSNSYSSHLPSINICSYTFCPSVHVTPQPASQSTGPSP